MKDKIQIKKIGLIFFLIMTQVHFFLCGIVQAESLTPMSLIKTVSEEVFLALNTYPVSGPPEFLPKRREAIKTILNRNFDSMAMAKLALGKHWKPLSAEQRQKFSNLFYWRLYSFYILRIELYSDQTILYKNEKISSDKATVLIRVSSGQYPEFDITYRLKMTDSGWKIYDVVIEGVSLVSNYRNQFNSFLSKKNTFDDLLKKLQEKAPDNAQVL